MSLLLLMLNVHGGILGKAVRVGTPSGLKPGTAPFGMRGCPSSRSFMTWGGGDQPDRPNQPAD